MHDRSVRADERVAERAVAARPVRAEVRGGEDGGRADLGGDGGNDAPGWSVADDEATPDGRVERAQASCEERPPSRTRRHTSASARAKSGSTVRAELGLRVRAALPGGAEVAAELHGCDRYRPKLARAETCRW